MAGCFKAVCNKRILGALYLPLGRTRRHQTIAFKSSRKPEEIPSDSAANDWTALQQLNLPYSPNLKAMSDSRDADLIIYKLGMGYASLMHNRNSRRGVPKAYGEMGSEFDEFHKKIVDFVLPVDQVHGVSISRMQYMLIFILTPSKQLPHMLVWMKKSRFHVHDDPGVKTQDLPIARLPSIVGFNCPADCVLTVFVDASLVHYNKRQIDGQIRYTGRAGGGVIIYFPGGELADALCCKMGVFGQNKPDAGEFETKVAVGSLEYIDKTQPFKKFKCIQVCTDCQQLSDLCQGHQRVKPTDFNKMSAICVCIKSRDEVIFRHIHRELNVKAHKMANLGRDLVGKPSWDMIVKCLGPDLHECSLQPAFRTKILGPK